MNIDLNPLTIRKCNKKLQKQWEWKKTHTEFRQKTCSRGSFKRAGEK